MSDGGAVFGFWRDGIFDFPLFVGGEDGDDALVVGDGIVMSARAVAHGPLIIPDG